MGPICPRSYDFKEDEQWGEVLEIELSFDEFGDYKHFVFAQHLAYFQRQDGNLFDDVIAQCELMHNSLNPFKR
jgi:hypothetical protein